jgi:hypothetical protein
VPITSEYFVFGGVDPDVGAFVHPLATERVCSAGLRMTAPPGTRVRAKIYTVAGGVRDDLIAEGSAIATSPWYEFLDVPISAQLVAGWDYDVAFQIDGTLSWGFDNSPVVPTTVDGWLRVDGGEESGVAAPTRPVFRLGWTTDPTAEAFDLAKPGEGSPPPLALSGPFSRGAYIESLIAQEVYALGIYADIGAGDVLTVNVYDATGTTRGPLLASGSASSAAPGARWHDVPVSASLLAGADYDIEVIGGDSQEVRYWYLGTGFPYDAYGTIRVVLGEVSGGTAAFDLVWLRVRGCNATLTPVAHDPARTPMFLGVPVPNPATQRVHLGYAVDEDGPVSIEVFDVAGRRISTPMSARAATAGPGEIDLDVSRFASGVYFVRLKTATKSTSRKLVVTR